MSASEKSVSILNDVIEILNDRIEGYERAMKDVEFEDVDLKAMFANLIHESRGFRNDLIQEVTTLGGEPERGTTATGQIHKAWMDLKAAFTGKDRESILSSCEFGDKAAIKAYDDALEDNVSASLRETLISQRDSIQRTHDTISQYLRSSQAAY
ncbi:ferritin-like domain-containing protein [Xanthocytophaga flava]|uniref:ferritin-like domain-containing protein n=1 Tax=Xanthocytophaga flava TaxID=3048013 RepID=UPI0028D2C10B|nr:PA2169 family four-helix-bundle protein [Xanthocytophaga flavus]MDJ1472312.1 PA2169 family four-helix-bundle protein [Xanthocytophaga flavus]